MKNTIEVKLKNYRPDIDGIRAFAVCSVIINHINKDLIASGYLGVDIFFVISGYVITASLVNRNFNNFKEFIFGFFQRRICRLVPSLAFFVLIFTLLISLFAPNPDVSIKTGLTSLLGFSNIFLVRQANNYFGDFNSLNPFIHTWSLSLEEQFYLLFPFIFWFSGFTSKKAKGFINLLFLLIVFTVISFIGFVYFYQNYTSFTYYLLPTRFWEISSGAIVYLCIFKKIEFINLIKQTSHSITFLLILIILFFPNSWAIQNTTLIVFLTSMLLINTNEKTLVYKILTLKKVRYIGLISYPLYLWHWGVISIGNYTIGIQWWSVPILISIIFIAAEFTYIFIEEPVRKAKINNLDLKNIFRPLSFLFITFLSCFSIFKNYQKLYVGNFNNFKEDYDIKKSYFIKTKEWTSEWKGKKCTITAADIDKKIINFQDCYLGKYSPENRNITVIGNSLSLSFSRAFDELVKKNNYVILTSALGGSPVAEIPKPYERRQSKYYWDAIVPSLISNLKRGDILFLISDIHNQVETLNLPPDWQIGFNKKYYTPPNKNSPTKNLKLFEEGLLRLLNELDQNGAKLAVLRPLPDPTDCIMPFKEWFNLLKDPSQCKFLDKETIKSRRMRINNILTSLENKFPNRFKAVDLENIFCEGKICSYYDEDNNLLYVDGLHPTFKAAELSRYEIYRQLNNF